jgi:hypothetical protein
MKVALATSKTRQAAVALGAAVVIALAPGTAVAQWSMPDDRFAAPVLLELFTAQGCAACPPADEMMLELAMREDVIALALHVDYWDYIGWVDVFADPEHGERQKRYARRHGHSTIYTPQVVVNGIDVVEGFRAMRVMDTIAAHAELPARIDLSLTRLGDTGGVEIRAHLIDDAGPLAAARGATRAVGALAELSAQADTRPEPAPLTLHLVRYTPSAQIEILTGENAGRMAHYANIVRSWRDIGTWDPRMPLQMSVNVDGDDPTVVIVQEAGQGQVLAAARLR